MSMIRGIDRAHDIDLGPSGYAPRGHHFAAIGDVPTATEIRMHEERVARLKARTGRPLNPRCLEPLRMAAVPCQRRANHPGAHQSKR